MPTMPVNYNSVSEIKCTVDEKLSTIEPSWTLTRDGQEFEITNGLQSEVTGGRTTNVSEVKLKNISELWAGKLVSDDIFRFTNTCM